MVVIYNSEILILFPWLSMDHRPNLPSIHPIVTATHLLLKLCLSALFGTHSLRCHPILFCRKLIFLI